MEELKKLLEEKYKPVLVVYLAMIPPVEHIMRLHKQLMDWGYNVLIIPGNMENKVELLSIIDSTTVSVEELQTKVFDFLILLEKEAASK